MHEKFFQTARTNMVKNQILPNNVKNKDLIEALMSTKKELFVPKNLQDLTYTDSDIHLFNNRYLMRTFILAKMLDKCSFKKSDSILVIGCLTGYSLALLSNMVSYVFGIDSNKEAIEKADKNLNGLNILNCSVFHKKDLSSGLDRNAPYDKIFIEGSVKNIPNNIIKQLKDEGEVFTVIKNDEYLGDYIRGLRVETGISIEKFFNTNISELEDFII